MIRKLLNGKYPLLIILALLTYCNESFADDEASNIVYVKSGMHGRTYAKCVPDETYGSKGTTYVYKVQKGEDKLIFTYNWYSKQIYLLSNGGSIVRMGPWARGHEANDAHLAIAFYKNGKLLKRYSTLDVAANKKNISTSKSHYTVFKEIIGFRWREADNYVFDAKTHDGEMLSYDVNTGGIIEKK